MELRKVKRTVVLAASVALLLGACSGGQEAPEQDDGPVTDEATTEDEGHVIDWDALAEQGREANERDRQTQQLQGALVQNRPGALADAEDQCLLLNPAFRNADQAVVRDSDGSVTGTAEIGPPEEHTEGDDRYCVRWFDLEVSGSDYYTVEAAEMESRVYEAEELSTTRVVLTVPFRSD